MDKQKQLKKLEEINLDENQLKELARLFTSLNETQIKELLKDTQELKVLNPGNGFKSADIGIPKEWLQQMEQLKKKDPDISPQQLIKDTAKKLDTADTPIRDLARTIRDIKHTLDYINQMKDPSKRGLYDELIKLQEKLYAQRKEPKIILQSEDKKSILNKVERLEDSGKLIGYIANLFEGKHEKVSVASLLRKMAFRIVVATMLQ